MKVKIKGVGGIVAVYEFVVDFFHWKGDETTEGSVKFNIRRWKDDPENIKEIETKQILNYTLYHDDGKEIETIVINDIGV